MIPEDEEYTSRYFGQVEDLARREKARRDALHGNGSTEFSYEQPMVTPGENETRVSDFLSEMAEHDRAIRDAARREARAEFIHEQMLTAQGEEPARIAANHIASLHRILGMMGPR